MKHEKLKSTSDKQFRRVTGVKRGTFAKIIDLLKVAQKKKIVRFRDVSAFYEKACQEKTALLTRQGNRSSLAVRPLSRARVVSSSRENVGLALMAIGQRYPWLVS